MAPSQRLSDLPSAVRGAIVENEHLVVLMPENAVHESRQIVPLVIGRHEYQYSHLAWPRSVEDWRGNAISSSVPGRFRPAACATLVTDASGLARVRCGTPRGSSWPQKRKMATLGCSSSLDTVWVLQIGPTTRGAGRGLPSTASGGTMIQTIDPERSRSWLVERR
jgi:hypothetical protein